jgi:pilus assembly protein CpaF
MSLAERLAQNNPSDKRADIRARIQSQLVDALGPKLYDSSLSEEELERLVQERLRVLLEDEKGSLTLRERAELTREIGDGVLGLGPIEPFLRDPTVSEVMVNGYDTIYVERDGLIDLTDAAFFSEEQLRHVIDKVVGRVGRRVDESSPYVDARLPDGSRVNAILPPLAIDGPTLTIRRFAADPLGIEELISVHTVTEAVAEFLSACVRGRASILVSGGTGVGKTTTLNALSSFIPHDERVVTIEDAAELQLQQPHVVRLESRPPNIEGAGEVTIRDLVKNALRMRPDRIIVGEVRGPEALDMLQAMNTGHDGSISTIHANSPRDALSRLETMSLMSGMEISMTAIREQAASALNLVIHQARLKDGTRHFTHITEVVGMEGDVIALQDIFLFDYGAGIDDNGRFLGRLKPTGLRPRVLEKLAERGIELPIEIFAPESA